MLSVRLNEAKGVAAVDLDEALRGAWATLREGAAAGKNGFGWMNLPEKGSVEFKAMGAELARFESIILIGIGGSALGAQMLMTAFLDPFYPFARAGRPAVFVADNADGATNEAIWRQVNPARTAILVVSKSGRTLETLSNFIFFRSHLYDAIGAEAEKHIFAVTDPAKGFMRAYANAKGTHCLVLPEDTGGRYSVLSSCGMPVAAAVGIDVDGLLNGAAAMKKALLADPEHSVAQAIARDVIRCYKAGRNVTVFWSYGDRLKSVGEWFAQLWGESLGKNNLGMTPQAALGSIDQHSQLQLYTSGPADKFFFFLNDKLAPATGLKVPGEELFAEAGYMQGVSSQQILDCERHGVAASLLRCGLPVCEIELERTDEFCLGGLIFLLEAVTALVGFALGVDPFDQPGVEEGKNYALALCGNAAYDKYNETLRAIAAETHSTDFSVKD